MTLEAEQVQAAQGDRPRQQPWREAGLAALYDAFPFDADIPLYLRLAAQAGGNVLELACGTGRVLLPLAQAGYHVTGVDASPAMLDLARQKLAQAGPEIAGRVRLVNGDLRNVELSERFNLAIVAVKSFAYLLDRRDQLL